MVVENCSLMWANRYIIEYVFVMIYSHEYTICVWMSKYVI